MLLQTIEALFRKYRLFCYQKLFAAVREKPGSLSATEAFSADIIHLLGSPTISQFAETIGISQPNATYKVNQLAAKGYLHKTVQAHDRREIVLTTSEKFSGYFDENEEEMQKKVAALKEQKTELENYDYGEVGRSFHFSPKELAEFLKAQQIKPTLPSSEGISNPIQEDSHEE